MQPPIAEVFVICSKSKSPFNLMGRLIMQETGLPFSHYSIAIKYKDDIFISEAVWPRPRFTTPDDWLKRHSPIFIFRKEVKNQLRLFEMTNWMAILCTKSWYSVLQLILIYIKLRFKPLTKWADTVILNDDEGLVCCEYVTRYLNRYFPEDFSIEKNQADSIGMREPFDALTQSWIILDSTHYDRLLSGEKQE